VKRFFRRVACSWRGFHLWDYDDTNGAKRTCSCCGRHEWLFWRRFPMGGEPAWSWTQMRHEGQE